MPEEVFAGDFRAILGPLTATTDSVKAADDKGTFLAYLDTRRDVVGRGIGAVGFCMGGRMAIATAGTYIWTEISERAERSRDSTDTLGVIRPIGQDTWLIDAASPSQEESLNFSSTLYTATRNGLQIRPADARNSSRIARWVRCLQ